MFCDLWSDKKTNTKSPPQTFDFKMSIKKQNKTFEPALSNVQISV